MKKIKILSLLIVAICIITAFCGCKKNVPNPPVVGMEVEQVEELRNNIEADIKRVYPKMTYDKNNLIIETYMGTYNGHIVFIAKDDNDGFSYFEDRIEDYTFFAGFEFECLAKYLPRIWLNVEAMDERIRYTNILAACKDDFITEEDRHNIFLKLKEMLDTEQLT